METEAEKEKKGDQREGKGTEREIVKRKEEKKDRNIQKDDPQFVGFYYSWREGRKEGRRNKGVVM